MSRLNGITIRIEFDYNNKNDYKEPWDRHLIEQNKDRFNWRWLCQYQRFPEEFIEKYKDYVNYP